MPSADIVFMQSIEFQCYSTYYINSVRCNLSNGQSYAFDTKGYKYNHRKLNFDPDRPVRAVAAYDGNGIGNHMYHLQFMDAANQEICVYNK